MSVTTNVITKQKQSYYNAGDNASVVDTAVDNMAAIIVPVNTYGDNCVACFAPTVACTLTNCTVAAGDADIIGNTAGNAVTYTVNCNAVTCATLNCEADLAANVAAGSSQAMTVNSLAGVLTAGQVVLITVSTEAAADSNVAQTVTLHLERN